MSVLLCVHFTEGYEIVCVFVFVAGADRKVFKRRVPAAVRQREFDLREKK